MGSLNFSKGKYNVKPGNVYLSSTDYDDTTSNTTFELNVNRGPDQYLSLDESSRYLYPTDSPNLSTDELSGYLYPTDSPNLSTDELSGYLNPTETPNQENYTKLANDRANRLYDRKCKYKCLLVIVVLLVVTTTVLVYFLVTIKTTEDLSDCLDIMKQDGDTENGKYFITTWQSRQRIQVYCDMSTNGGGWTVFQYRHNGLVNFFRDFSEYENGFGNLNTEFWLGLRLLHEMTSQSTSELRVDVTSTNNSGGFETFQNFSISAGPDYTLNLGKMNTSMEFTEKGLILNNGCQFTTFDHDADRNKSNCAITLHGGWWYNACGYTNLNGHYATPGTLSKYNSKAGMAYLALFDNWKSLKTSKMMFRRHN